MAAGDDSRLPEDFDGDEYLALHPDVKAAGVEPGRHYLKHGRKEGRAYKRERLQESAYAYDGLRSVHNHDFMSQPDFQRAYNRGVKAAQGQDYRWYWRVHLGLWAAEVAARLEGDFVECGVNRGFLSSAIMEHLNWNSRGKMFYLLDTFSGLELDLLTEGEMAAGANDKNRVALQSGFYVSGVESVEANFCQWQDNVRIIAGVIPQTLADIQAEKVAFLHIDLNCTQPEVAALRYLWPRLVAGAPILLDDYAYRGYEAQKTGMDELAAEKGVSIASLPTGQGLLIKPPD